MRLFIQFFLRITITANRYILVMNKILIKLFSSFLFMLDVQEEYDWNCCYQTQSFLKIRILSVPFFIEISVININFIRSFVSIKIFTCFQCFPLEIFKSCCFCNDNTNSNFYAMRGSITHMYVRFKDSCVGNNL